MDFLIPLFLHMIDMSITASYIIIIILAIRFCIRKFPKVFSYLLWGIVGFRLICPISFSSILSVFNFSLFDMKTTVSNHGTFQLIAPNIGTMQKPELAAGINAVNHMIKNQLPTATPYYNINPIQILITIATLIWITGIAVLLIYSVFSYIRLKYRVTTAILFYDNIYECDFIGSPFVMGVFHPRIYIPFRLNEKEQEYILLHEQFHIKRLDNLIKPIAFLILTIYWINPLVWLAYYCMSKDMEMSCDEKVLSDLGESVKSDYSMSLLNFATGHRFPSGSPLAFGETSTKERVKNVLNFKKPGFWLLTIATLLCVIITIVCCSNANIASSYFRYNDRQTKDAGEKTLEYQYSIDNDIHSVAVYEEIYENGVLYDTRIKMYGNIKENEIKHKNTISITSKPLSEKKGQFTSLNWEVAYEKGSKVITTIPTTLPNGVYHGYSLTALGEGSSKKIKIEPGSDKILFAAFFSNNQIKALSCEDLMAGPEYYTSILKNMSKLNACVVVHTVFSNKDADTLVKQLTSSYAMKLYQNRNQYIGNAPGNGNLLRLLGISYTMGEFTTMLQTVKEPYILRMRFKNKPENKEEFDSIMKRYSDLLLALIDNAGVIEWSYPDSQDGELKEKIIQRTAEEASNALNIDDIKDYGKSVSKVQRLLDKMSAHMEGQMYK